MGGGTGGRASGEDILAVEQDVIPLDWDNAFQQGEIHSICDRVALTEAPGDFPRLLVDNASQDQVPGSCRLSGALARKPASIQHPRSHFAYLWGDGGVISVLAFVPLLEFNPIEKVSAY